jgi:hypothetical protein
MVEPPKDPLTSEELPPESRNWPEIEWEGGSLDSNPLYRYPYGGEEHRHEPALDDELPLNPQDAAQTPRRGADEPTLAAGGELEPEDLRRVMASPACWQPNHPGRARHTPWCANGSSGPR